MNLVPTASTTASLALGDALAMTLLVRKGFREEQFAAFHPGGKLGRKLMSVESVMHGGDAAPIVRLTTLMPDVIHEMSSKRLGMTCVVDDDGRLAGVFTDGDLRRLMMTRPPNAVLALTAGEAMTPEPAHDHAATCSPSRRCGSWKRTRSPRSSSSTPTAPSRASCTCTICGGRR